MPSEARLKKNYRTIKRGPKELNFGASKPGVRGGPGPLGPPPGSASATKTQHLQKTKSTHESTTKHN